MLSWKMKQPPLCSQQERGITMKHFKNQMMVRVTDPDDNHEPLRGRAGKDSSTVVTLIAHLIETGRIRAPQTTFRLGLIAKLSAETR